LSNRGTYIVLVTRTQLSLGNPRDVPLEPHVGASSIPPNDQPCIGVRMVQEPDSSKNPLLIACEVLVMKIESPSTSLPCRRHVQGTLTTVSAQQLPKQSEVLLEIEGMQDSCGCFKALYYSCHRPIGALPFSLFLLSTGVNGFGNLIPPDKPCCIDGPKYVFRVRSLILLGTALAGNATSLDCQAAHQLSHSKRSPL
jgi:hypothetical protein